MVLIYCEASYSSREGIFKGKVNLKINHSHEGANESIKGETDGHSIIVIK